MSDQRAHYVTTTDGVTIGGSVHGGGPPLVFVQGILGDGDLDWQALLPHLTDRFTCYLPSMRGRGLSDDHPDLGIRRQTEDLLAYVDSLEAPTGLVGWSNGANLALFAAGTQPDSVPAVALIEPIANTVMDENEQAALGAAVARAGQLAAEGRLADATRAFASLPFNAEDIAAAERAGYFEAAGRYIPNLLAFFQQLMEYQEVMPDDPAVLNAIEARVLVLHGSDTTPFLETSVKHVAEHIPDTQLKEIPATGHAAPLARPEALARALTDFFAPSKQPV